MSTPANRIEAKLALQTWRGERGTYRLVTFAGKDAEAIAAHALMHRLEFGKMRGFGSVKVTAQVGETRWKSSVFPQNKSDEWILLVSRKVCRAEALEDGQPLTVSLELL